MGVVSYTCSGDKYRIEPIENIEFIDEDITTVGDVISDTLIKVYRENMVISVNQGYAYSVYKNDMRVGFFYNRMEGYKYIGCCIWLGHDSICTLIGLKQMFDVCDAHKISFVPHHDTLKYFKSMVKGDSIRNYHFTGNSEVVIMREPLYSNGVKLAAYLGLENE